MAVQAEAVFQGGDQRGPVLAAGERGGPDHAEAPGDLLAAGAGKETGTLDVDAGVDEGGGDPLGEILEHVGGFRAGPGGEADVVDLVDGDQAGAGVSADPQAASMMSVRFARRMAGRPRNRANSIAIIFAVAAGGTVM